MRLIHAVRDLAAQTGERIETVALHTDVDRSATFVREADIAYDLGPAAARPYLNMDLLAQALQETGADAAWVGWGFVAEDPAFAELCEKIGVTFVGPSADAMRKLGDKIGAKLIAEEVGVPVAAWSRGAVETLDAAKVAAAEIGYPMMLKATAGGGGRGIRLVTSDEELEDAYQRTSDEALRAFGSGVVFLERTVTGARHVEVQVIADSHGNAWALGVRDCSVQRRNQKIIEESASPVLSPEQVEELKTAAERLAVRVGYCGAATVEFLYQPVEKLFAFLEVNTRLQVEHPITETAVNYDLVRAQLFVAGGGRLEGEKPVERGHAIEARLNAEDPDRDFAPSPGRIDRLQLPAGPGIRVDTGVSEGDTIPADFDSMIAKIIAYGRDRDQALGRLRRAMGETTVIVEGGATNKSFVLDLLDQPEVIDGSADTGWIDRVRAEGRLVSHKHSAVAVAAAAIAAYEVDEHLELQRLLTTAAGGRPQVQHESGRPVDLKLRGSNYRVRVARVGAQRFRVAIEAGTTTGVAVVEVDRFDRHFGQIEVNGERFRLATGAPGPVQMIEVDGVAHRVSLDEGGVVRSPAPALVVACPLEVGEEVEAGDPVLVLESMKMETVLRAPFKARLKERDISVGSQVEAGARLLRLEPLADESEVADAAPATAVPLDLPAAPGQTASIRAATDRRELLDLLLGYDYDPLDEKRLLDDYVAVRAEGGQSPVADELALVEAFCDLAELTATRTAGGEGHEPSAWEYFRTHLRSLDVERAGVPESFQAKLSAALRHYGVTELDRTPELESAVFRIYLAQQRFPAGAKALSALLSAWLRETPPDPASADAVSEALERVVAVTAGRFTGLHDLARGLQFAWFGQPLLLANRAEVFATVGDHLEYLDANPDAADRSERIAAMVRSTEPLIRLLGDRLADKDVDNSVMLEVLIRRYYGNKHVTGFEAKDVDGQAFVVADRPESLLVSAATRFEGLPRVLGALGGVVSRTTDVDVYVAWADRPRDPEAMAAALYEVVAANPLPRATRRVTITVAGSAESTSHHYFTYRPSTTGVAEERLIRGLHPYIAHRMQMTQLGAFDLTRMPSVDEEVALFSAVARENPADKRLVAFAQVRDLTELRDDDGHLVALPTAENTIAACLDSIRRNQASRGKRGQLNTNRIVLYIWPPSEFGPDDLRTIARRVVDSTEGVGLEEIVLIARQRNPESGELDKVVLRVTFDDATGAVGLSLGGPKVEPVVPLDAYRQKVLVARKRGMVYPYELTDLLGEFREYDLVESEEAGARELVPVDRPKGLNKAAIVVGTVTTKTDRHPEGITRAILLGDPTKSLGALSEPECSRVIGAIDLAEKLGVPLEWYALSAGARISMESGTENMDWVAAALKRIVEFTQAGGEINVVVAGINVGAQPYWNAEATMLMHTKGILVMTPDSAMVLTGKNALDFSGGVSAEDNFGIGGYDRVMGPNGQAQYWAPSLTGARDVLMSHYEHTYVVPGEKGPRSVETTDPSDRDMSSYPHEMVGSEFATVGEIFSSANPDRKKPFDIRSVMRALSDQDHAVLERWAGMADADTVVAADAHLGGQPVCLLGIESKAVQRKGFPPTDGPDSYTAGTLFPQSSKKAARAINAASGNRPLVVLANLSGFDGSPESMRKVQLEYGAEIGRAIVNFDGPIVFCVISRYHGGAFVVFSKTLNPNMTVLALEGSYASVLGGAPAAAVVFAGDVNARVDADPRIADVEARVAAVGGAERAALVKELDDVRTSVQAEKISELAAEFDSVHDIHRAVRVGSVDEVVSVARLRPRVIEVIQAFAGAANGASGPSVEG